MTFKKAVSSTLLLVASSAFSSLSHAQNSMDIDKDVLAHLLISETSEQGAMINNGKSMYMKRFNLSLINTGTKNIDLAKGCFYATDEDNKIRIKPKIFQPALGSTIKPRGEGDAVEGYIEFLSSDKSIYQAEFVKWTSDCDFMK
ncbi:DUF4354 family protein [Serratia ficaria]|uniref:DUF4354 family protein n=1 Tax=Serratia ficaria TaxID=61651 RepID=UPI002178758E|nr:DUF4354 family protein [Serratia ficaria]CAI1226223.1 Uncharacterised protein [Serratia ficaria]CAI2536313.1 Uncharacterised protein [Serratia ficaria]CAI2536865.1 Uncharacterised protein [Serratia ficaria]CAI2538557.1 Uncharacterised protein [Serratia ficaria]